MIQISNGLLHVVEAAFPGVNSRHLQVCQVDSVDVLRIELTPVDVLSKSNSPHMVLRIEITPLYALWI